MMPTATGIGLRPPHHLQVLAQTGAAAWFEVHAENYFADGGVHVECLSRIRESYPVSLHGVGLSLGSTDPLDAAHLQRLARAIDRFAPALLSEHLSWSSVGGRFANDLLPLPHTEEALRHVSARIVRVQEALGRQILLENVSSYLTFAGSTLSEWEFLSGVVAESGCGILLDLNNVYVSAHNHRFDPGAYLEGIPAGVVPELHLAGHARVGPPDRYFLVDDHASPVCEPVWELYRAALQRFGSVPALIEWDEDLPAFEVLQREARKADSLRCAAHADAA